MKDKNYKKLAASILTFVENNTERVWKNFMNNTNHKTLDYD